MKEEKNTIDGVELKPERASGNSTRQIDHAINLLFGGYRVKVLDHNKYGESRNSNRMLFDRIVDRLKVEHNLSDLVKFKRIKFDDTRLTLELLP